MTRSAVLVGLSAASVVVVLVAVSCSPPPPKLREVCGNGFDDDGNGLADCADPDCIGQTGCPARDAGQFGSCAKCSDTCARQETCLQFGFNSDAPLPDCAAGRCQSFNEALQVAVEVDTQQGGWGFVSPAPRSMQMRFVRKTALDGTAVSCAVITALATGTTGADADQIERSGKFNLIGYDVTPLSSGVGSVIRQPFVNVGTSTDFLIWVEIWSGPRDSTTKLPTGLRKGWGCFETGPAVDALISADNCPTSPTSPTCRTIRVEMPGPQ